MENIFLFLSSAASPYLVGIFLVGVIFIVSVLLSYFLVGRRFRRYELAAQAAASIAAEIRALRNAFEGRYMPLALSKTLDRADQIRIKLQLRSWSIRRKSQLVAVEAEAAAVIGDMRNVAARPMTAADYELNRQALIAELAQVEADAVDEQREVEASASHGLALVFEKRDRARMRIARSQELFAASAVF